MKKNHLGIDFSPQKAKAKLCVLDRWEHQVNQVASLTDLLAPTPASSCTNEHGVGLDWIGQKPERFLSGANFFQTLKQLGSIPPCFKIRQFGGETHAPSGHVNG